jgi:hypothetical protein
VTFRSWIMLGAVFFISVPVTAQTMGEVGVYWDSVEWYRYPSDGHGTEAPLIYDGYVVLMVEDVVTGMAFELIDYRSDTSLVSMEYPAGLQIGDAWSGGVEIGFTEPFYGFLGTRMNVCHFTLANHRYPEEARIEVDVVPHLNFGAVVYTNGEAQIVPVYVLPVGSEASSFGAIKNLFR